MEAGWDPVAKNMVFRDKSRTTRLEDGLRDFVRSSSENVELHCTWRIEYRKMDRTRVEAVHFVDYINFTAFPSSAELEILQYSNRGI